MPGGEIGKHSDPALQVVFNYWENRAHPGTDLSSTDARNQLHARLDELLKKGLTHILSFVPWQAVEADISHSLMRFLQAIAERHMTLTLVPTPELGLHFANSGLPKDVFPSEARLNDGQPCLSFFPPNAFEVPSHFSAEFSKRYFAFLSRVDSVLSSFERSLPPSAPKPLVTVALTGSFWKYYRPATAAEPFDGYGEASRTCELAFRKHLDQYYAQREFCGEGGMTQRGQHWKMPHLDGINRKLFYQNSEDVFRNRVAQSFRRKTIRLQDSSFHEAHVKVLQAELFTPEADPYFLFDQVRGHLSAPDQGCVHGQSHGFSGTNPIFEKLSRYLSAAAQRASVAAGEPTRPFIRWSALGEFRKLTDAERQFLILKSLVLFGTGSVLIDEEEWFMLSVPSRARVAAFARALEQGDIKLPAKAMLFTPHLWSELEAIGQTLSRTLGPSLKVLAHSERFFGDESANLLVVDPRTVLSRELVTRFIAWLQGDSSTLAKKPGFREKRYLVMPRSSLYTIAAKAELEKFLAKRRKLEIRLGLAYELFGAAVLPEQSSDFDAKGVLVLYDPIETAAGAEVPAEITQFVRSMLGLAEIQPPARVADGRIESLELDLTPVRDFQKGGLALFLFNPTANAVRTRVEFGSDVEVSDLAMCLKQRFARADGMGMTSSNGEAMPVSGVDLELPPAGIMALSAEGGELALERGIQVEEEEAEATAASLKRGMQVAASTELTGGDLWS